MPIIAIAGAVIAGVIAAPAVGAVIAGGFAALDLAGALAITAAVGATLGAVGAITKDKGLMTAGLVIGGIGAVGAIASSFGAFSSTSSLFGTSTDVASDVAFAQSGQAAAAADDAMLGYYGVESAVNITPSVLGTSAENAASAGDFVQSFSQVAPITPVTTNALSDVVPAAAPNVADQTAAVVGGPSSVQPGVVQPNIPTNPTPVSAPVAPAVTGAPAAAGTTTDQTAAAGNFEASLSKMNKPGMLAGIMDFTKNNPMASYGLIQAAGSFISGATNPLTPAQIDSMNAQAAANRANTVVTNQIAANMAGGVPVARVRPVNSAPVTGMPTGGMINTGSVTGVPA